MHFFIFTFQKFGRGFGSLKIKIQKGWGGVGEQHIAFQKRHFFTENRPKNQNYECTWVASVPEVRTW
jgi:hypothetical protein